MTLWGCDFAMHPRCFVMNAFCVSSKRFFIVRYGDVPMSVTPRFWLGGLVSCVDILHFRFPWPFCDLFEIAGHVRDIYAVM